MIKEALEYAIGLSKAETLEIEGITYFNDDSKRLNPVISPISTTVKVRTLTGIVDLVKAGIEGLTSNAATEGVPASRILTSDDVFVLIRDHLNVELVTRVSDKHGRRRTLVSATCDQTAEFRFGQFYEPEFFTIGLQSCFVPTVGDIDYLVRIASNITSEAVTIAEDDGIAQKATLRKGVILKREETLKNRVKLAPFRTFREADQPISEFVFRVQAGDEGEMPRCAIFEADGGKWKNDAMQNISKFLEVAIDNIPVIS